MVDTCSIATSTERVLQASAETLTEVRSYENTTTTNNSHLNNNEIASDLGTNTSVEKLGNEKISISHAQKALHSSNSLIREITNDRKRLDECFDNQDQVSSINTPGENVSRDLNHGSGSVLPSLPRSTSSQSAVRIRSSTVMTFQVSAIHGTSSRQRSHSQDRLLGLGSAGDDEFVDSEFYIDESLPSSATSAAAGLYQRQLMTQQLEIRQTIADYLTKNNPGGSYDEETVILLLQVLANFVFIEAYFFVCLNHILA